MQKVKDILKKHSGFIKAVILSLLPLLAGSILCFSDGRTIGDLYLPASEWNDEIFYYKQVESVVSCGMPQGFFGYDESRALNGGFGTWNPLLFLPFVLWGWLFGWNLMSPILCNIVLMSLAMFLFVILTKPDRNQTVALVILYLSSLFTTRYMLSTMAETILIFYAVVFWGLCISYREDEKLYKLVLCYVLVFMMSMGRPYFLLFLCIPAYYLIRRKKAVGISVTVITVAATAGMYFWITANFCAPYFIDSIKTYWIRQYQLAGVWEGIKYTVKELYEGALEFLELCLGGIAGTTERHGLALEFLILFLAILIQTVISASKKRKRDAGFFGFLTGSFLVVLSALMLLYQLMAGARHFVVFITLAVFALSKSENGVIGQAIVTGALLCLVYIRVPDQKLYCELPYREENMERELDTLETELQNNMELSGGKAPSYGNVVIWTLSDEVDGKDTMTKWQLLYAVPAGYGINCCSGGYVENNLDTLKSRYLAVPAGGNLDERCIESGRTEIARTGNLAVFDMKTGK